MQQLVKVLANNPDGTGRVLHIRQSACSGDCHKCSGCGAAKQTMFAVAKNPVDAPVGAVVNLRSESGPVLAAAAMLYMMPLATFFLGYLLGAVLWQRGGLAGALGFALGVGIVVIYDRKVVKKADIGYTITAFAGDALVEAMRKGEHNHG